MKKILKFLKKRWYLILAIILVVGWIYIQNQAKSAKSKETSYTIRKQDIKNTLSLSGQIDADEKVALKFQTSGLLSWVGVKVGDSVKKNQLIASLDQRDLKNRLNKYLNAYAVERNTFEQTNQDNWNSQFDLSPTIRDEAKRILSSNQYNLNNAVLDVEYQNLTLEYANLFTPIDGVVTNVDTPYPGVNVTPAGAEFDVVNPKTIYFSATADQTDVVNLKNGMTGNISFDAYPNETFQGKLYYTSFTPKTNETGTVYEVRFKLDPQAMAKPLRMGMTGDLEILVKEYKDSLAVPSYYIGQDSKGSYLKEKDNGKTVKKYVTIGDEINGNTIITNGVAAGDVIYD